MRSDTAGGIQAAWVVYGKLVDAGRSLYDYYAYSQHTLEFRDKQAFDHRPALGTSYGNSTPYNLALQEDGGALVVAGRLSEKREEGRVHFNQTHYCLLQPADVERLQYNIWPVFEAMQRKIMVDYARPLPDAPLLPVDVVPSVNWLVDMMQRSAVERTFWERLAGQKQFWILLQQLLEENPIVVQGYHTDESPEQQLQEQLILMALLLRLLPPGARPLRSFGFAVPNPKANRSQLQFIKEPLVAGEAVPREALLVVFRDGEFVLKKYDIERLRSKDPDHDNPLKRYGPLLKLYYECIQPEPQALLDLVDAIEITASEGSLADATISAFLDHPKVRACVMLSDQVTDKDVYDYITAHPLKVRDWSDDIKEKVIARFLNVIYRDLVKSFETLLTIYAASDTRFDDDLPGAIRERTLQVLRDIPQEYQNSSAFSAIAAVFETRRLAHTRFFTDVTSEMFFWLLDRDLHEWAIENTYTIQHLNDELKTSAIVRFLAAIEAAPDLLPDVVHLVDFYDVTPGTFDAHLAQQAIDAQVFELLNTLAQDAATQVQDFWEILKRLNELRYDATDFYRRVAELLVYQIITKRKGLTPEQSLEEKFIQCIGPDSALLGILDFDYLNNWLAGLKDIDRIDLVQDSTVTRRYRERLKSFEISGDAQPQTHRFLTRNQFARLLQYVPASHENSDKLLSFFHGRRDDENLDHYLEQAADFLLGLTPKDRIEIKSVLIEPGQDSIMTHIVEKSSQYSSQSLSRFAAACVFCDEELPAGQIWNLIAKRARAASDFVDSFVDVAKQISNVDSEFVRPYELLVKFWKLNQERESYPWQVHRHDIVAQIHAVVTSTADDDDLKKVDFLTNEYNPLQDDGDQVTEIFRFLWRFCEKVILRFNEQPSQNVIVYLAEWTATRASPLQGIIANHTAGFVLGQYILQQIGLESKRLQMLRHLKSYLGCVDQSPDAHYALWSGAEEYAKRQKSILVGQAELSELTEKLRGYYSDDLGEPEATAYTSFLNKLELASIVNHLKTSETFEFVQVIDVLAQLYSDPLPEYEDIAAQLPPRSPGMHVMHRNLFHAIASRKLGFELRSCLDSQGLRDTLLSRKHYPQMNRLFYSLRPRQRRLPEHLDTPFVPEQFVEEIEHSSMIVLCLAHVAHNEGKTEVVHELVDAALSVVDQDPKWLDTLTKPELKRDFTDEQAAQVVHILQNEEGYQGHLEQLTANYANRDTFVTAYLNQCEAGALIQDDQLRSDIKVLFDAVSPIRKLDLLRMLKDDPQKFRADGGNFLKIAASVLAASNVTASYPFANSKDQRAYKALLYVKKALKHLWEERNFDDRAGRSRGFPLPRTSNRVSAHHLEFMRQFARIDCAILLQLLDIKSIQQDYNLAPMLEALVTYDQVISKPNVSDTQHAELMSAALQDARHDLEEAGWSTLRYSDFWLDWITDDQQEFRIFKVALWREIISGELFGAQTAQHILEGFRNEIKGAAATSDRVSVLSKYFKMIQPADMEKVDKLFKDGSVAESSSSKLPSEIYHDVRTSFGAYLSKIESVFEDFKRGNFLRRFRD